MVMTLIQSIFVILVGIGLSAFFFNLVRTGKLHEKFSLVWLVICGGCLIAPLVYPIIAQLANFVGIVDPKSFFFFGAIILLFLLGLQFSCELSVARQDRRKLVIYNVLLNERLELAEATIKELEDIISSKQPCQARESYDS